MDFHVVVCGIATLAASVGYAYHTRTQRKFASNSRIRSNSDSSAGDFFCRDLELNEQEGKAQFAPDVEIPFVSDPKEFYPSPSPSPDHNEERTTTTVCIDQDPFKVNDLSTSRSLKRKTTHDQYYPTAQDCEYPKNLTSIYPCKRTRTPTNDTDGDKDAQFEDYVLVSYEPDSDSDDVRLSPPPPYELTPTQPHAHYADTSGPAEAIPSNSDEENVACSASDQIPDQGTSSQAPENILSQNGSSSTTATDLDRPSPPLSAQQSSPTDVQASDARLEVGGVEHKDENAPSTATGGFNGPGAIKTSDLLPSKLEIQSPRPKFAAGGFASFAGANQGLGSFRFTPVTAQVAPKIDSIWRSEEPIFSDSGKKERERQQANAIGALSGRVEGDHGRAAPNQTTGEENEDVKLEIKGVRLYVKRGNGEFNSDGMMGTLRLLAEKDSAEERLLFRRDPLWQVSMNTRVNQTVRCTFDREEKTLRVILRECINGGGDASSGSAFQGATSNAALPGDQSLTTQVVIYAFKPGKSTSKQDFITFSETLAANPRFRQP